MVINVRLFALTREIAGKKAFIQTLTEGATLEDFTRVLYETHPAMRNLKLRFAVNMTYSTLDTILHENDEVACIPPVGGG